MYYWCGISQPVCRLGGDMATGGEPIWPKNHVNKEGGKNQDAQKTHFLKLAGSSVVGFVLGAFWFSITHPKNQALDPMQKYKRV